MNFFLLNKMLYIVDVINREKKYSLGFSTLGIIFLITGNIGYSMESFIKEEFKMHTNIKNIKRFLIDKTHCSYIEQLSEEEMRKEAAKCGIYVFKPLDLALEIKLPKHKSPKSSHDFFCRLINDFMHKLEACPDESISKIDFDLDALTGIITGSIVQKNNNVIPCFQYEVTPDEKKKCDDMFHYNQKILELVSEMRNFNILEYK